MLTPRQLSLFFCFTALISCSTNKDKRIAPPPISTPVKTHAININNNTVIENSTAKATLAETLIQQAQEEKVNAALAVKKAEEAHLKELAENEAIIIAARKIVANQQRKLREEAAEKEKAQAEMLAQKKLEEEAQKKKAEKDAARKEALVKRAEQRKQAKLKKEKARFSALAKERLSKKSTLSKQFNVPTRSEIILDSPTYTPLGAEKNGNIEGTIPPWTGKIQGKAGFTSGSKHPDMYPDERPMFTIHQSNYRDYANYLSEGQIELLKKYPDTFYMHIYPTHRDTRYNTLFEQRTAFNKKNTQMNNGIDGLSNYTGGIPFPAPQNGAEAMWNSRVAHPHPTIMGVFDDIATYMNGNKHVRRQRYAVEFPFANPNTPVGKVDDQISINAGLIHVTVEKPERIKGQMTVVHEALDQVTHGRKAWIYVPGSRRVRRAPSVGFDTPDGPGGLVTVDDALGFNGAMERYDWKLVDKKELYIPYHAYKFDSPETDYDTLLQTAHANPDFMRYELHRSWIVEATLKPGASHVYTKRRFYIDEDSWQIVLLESFDGRGNLWRVGILNTIYDYAVKGYIARAQMFHDLQSGSYIALKLINETSPSNFTATPKGSKYYSPANLRKMGTR